MLAKFPHAWKKWFVIGSAIALAPLAAEAITTPPPTLPVNGATFSSSVIQYSPGVAFTVTGTATFTSIPSSKYVFAFSLPSGVKPVTDAADPTAPINTTASSGNPTFAYNAGGNELGIVFLGTPVSPFTFSFQVVASQDFYDNNISGQTSNTVAIVGKIQSAGYADYLFTPNPLTILPPPSPTFDSLTNPAMVGEAIPYANLTSSNCKIITVGQTGTISTVMATSTADLAATKIKGSGFSLCPAVWVGTGTGTDGSWKKILPNQPRNLALTFRTYSPLTNAILTGTTTQNIDPEQTVIAFAESAASVSLTNATYNNGVNSTAYTNAMFAWNNPLIVNTGGSFVYTPTSASATLGTETNGTRTVSWTVPAGFVTKASVAQGISTGTYTNVFIANIGGILSSGANGGKDWLVRVDPVNQAPVIDSSIVTLNTNTQTLTNDTMPVAKEGDALTFSVTAHDPDAPIDSISYTWESSLNGGTSWNLETSTTSFISANLGYDMVQHPSAILSGAKMRLTVTDNDRTNPKSVTKTWTITTVNDTDRLPTAPTSAGITPATPKVTDALTASASGSTDADGDAITYDYVWLKSGTATAYTGATLAAGIAKKGETWTVSARAKTIPYTPYNITPAYSTSTVSAGVTISDSAPSITGASITVNPVGTAYVNSALTAVPGTWSDADGDISTASSYKYAWTIGTSTAVVATTASVTVAAPIFKKGDVVYVTITPTDGTLDGLAKTSAPITIANSLPSISGVTITPVTAYVDTTLTANPAGWSDADGDTASYKYAWTVNYVTVSGQTAATLTKPSFKKGDRVTVTVTPTNGGTGTDGAAKTSDPIIIANSAPNAPVVVELTGGTNKATAIVATVTPASPTDPDTADQGSIKYKYEWSKGGTLQTLLTTTATALTCTLPAANNIKGDKWTCQVTAIDASNATTAAPASNEIPIGNTAPTGADASVFILKPETLPPTVTQVITLAGTDVDSADTKTFSIVGTSPTKGTLSGLNATAGTVTYAVTDNTKEFYNGNPDPIYQADTFSYKIYDGKNDSSTYTITVTYRSHLPPTVTTTTLADPAITEQDTKAFSVSASYNNDIPGTSGTNATLTNVSWFVGTDTVAKQSTDLTGTSTTSYYSWTTDYNTIANDGTGHRPASKAFDVKCVVTDKQGATTSKTWSVTVNDKDREPAAPITVVIKNGATVVTSAKTGDTLTAEATGPTDADGDAITGYDFVWSKNFALTTNTGATLAAGTANKGEYWSVTAKAKTNPYNTGDRTAAASLTSAYVTIVNSAPNKPAVALTGGTNKATAIVATVTAAIPTDPDTGDRAGLQYKYEWTKGTLQSALTSTTTATTCTLPASNNVKGDKWTCQVTAIDAASTTTASDISNEITIGNTAPTASALVTGSNSYVKIVRSINLPNHTDQTLDLKTLVTDVDGAADITAFSQVGADPASMTWSFNANGTVTFTPTGTGEYSSSFQFNAADTSTATLAAGPITVSLLVRDNQPPNSPTAPALTSSPATAYINAVLTASATAPTVFDQDDVNSNAGAKQYKFHWKKDGVEVKVSDPVTITGTALSRTSTADGITTVTKGNWTCEITAFDGISESTPAITNQLLVHNSKPSITGVTLSSSGGAVAYVTSTLTATPAGWSDADSDAAGYIYQWVVSGTAVLTTTSNSATSTLPGNVRRPRGYFNKGDVVTINVTPDDGSTFNSNENHLGDSKTSTAITILNSAPTVTDKLGLAVTDKQSLPVDLAIGAHDVDGDTLTYTRTDTNDIHGTVAIVGSTATYAANWPELGIGATGTVTFNFKAKDTDNASSSPGTVTVVVTGVNDAPVATNGFLYSDANTDTNSGHSGSVTLAGTDIDVGDSIASYTIDSLPDSGEGTLYVGTSTSAVTVGQVFTGAAPTLTFVPANNIRNTTSFTFHVTDNNGPASLDSATGTIQITIGTPQWYPYFTWGIRSRGILSTWYNVQVFKGTGTAALAGTPVIDTNVDGNVMSPVEYFRAGNEGLLPGDYTYRAYTWDPATGEKGILVTNTASLTVINYGVAKPAESMTAIPTGSNTGAYTLNFVVPNARGYEAVVSGPNGWTATFRNIFRPDPSTGVIPLNQPVTLGVKLPAAGTYTWKARGFNPLDEVAGITATTPAWTGGPDIVVATPASPTGALTAPDGLLPKNGDLITAPDGSVTITLQWNPVAGAASYMVYLASSSAAPLLPFRNVGLITSMRMTLKPGSYSWSVMAVDAAGKPGPAGLASFDVMLNATTPVIQAVVILNGNNQPQQLRIFLMTGSAAVTSVDIQHFNGLTRKWEPFIALPVVNGVVILPAGVTFNPGDYIAIRAFAPNQPPGNFKPIIIGGAD